MFPLNEYNQLPTPSHCNRIFGIIAIFDRLVASENRSVPIIDGHITDDDDAHVNNKSLHPLLTLIAIEYCAILVLLIFGFVRLIVEGEHCDC